MAKSEKNNLIGEVLVDLAVFELNHHSHPSSFPVPNSMLNTDKLENFLALAKEHGYKVLSEPGEEGFTKFTCTR